ncbi:MAG: ketoacyl-ACP synthase III [Candidatus Marinimicrobia bacterium]|nr:ketoacyl-ACP synthase III [Candidatus Neomarinimicrobiota bacterium]
MLSTKIAGIGYHVPEKVITNFDLMEMMDTSNEWIIERTGIEKRHYVSEGEGTSDLGAAAARQAIEMAGIATEEIDLIICATISSDYFFPGSAFQIQDKLGLNGIGAFDIKVACSGFIYGLSIADQFIKTGQYKNILLVGGEVLSCALDISTEGRDMAVLFGDGAGAVILQPCAGESKIYSSHLHADGKYSQALWAEVPACNLKPHISHELLDQGRQYPHMNGREVFRHAIMRFPQVINEALDANNLTKEDISLIIPHQANLRITQAVAKRLDLTMDKVYSNIHKYGNTTAASIPIAMCEALAEGKFKRGDNLILASFGAGFSWGATALRY